MSKRGEAKEALRVLILKLAEDKEGWENGDNIFIINEISKLVLSL